MFLTGTIPLASNIAVADTNVVTFGDSITAGSPYLQGPGLGRRFGGYQQNLERRLRERVPDAFVYNWGVPAEETWQGVNRINAVLDFQRADWLLLLHGTNDLFEAISLQTTLANIGIMIDAGKRRGAQVVVSTILPSFFPGQGASRIPTTYNPGIINLAAQRRVILADLYSGMIDNWFNLVNSDTLHPNVAGYAEMGRLFCESMPICQDVDAPAPPLLSLPVPGNPWIDMLLLEDDES